MREKRVVAEVRGDFKPDLPLQAFREEPLIDDPFR
jgi:hypothetical protein